MTAQEINRKPINQPQKQNEEVEFGNQFETQKMNNQTRQEQKSEPTQMSDSEKATEALVKTRREHESVLAKQERDRQASIIQDGALDEVCDRILYTKARTEMAQILESEAFDELVMEGVNADVEVTANQQVTEGLQAFLGKTLLSGRLQKMLPQS